MKKALSMLFAVLFCCSIAALPVQAGENITYIGDGSNGVNLQATPGSIAIYTAEALFSGTTASPGQSDNIVTIDYVPGGTMNNPVMVFGGMGVQGAGSSISGNQVIMNNGMITATSYSIIGGYSHDGNALSNYVTINGGQVSGAIFGGISWSSNGYASYNTVIINGGSGFTTIYGGYGGNVEQNNVTVNNGTGNIVISGFVISGYAGTGNAIDNILTINGGTLNLSAYGGYVANAVGNAVGNNVTVNGGILKSYICGGYIASGSGNVEGNSVIINGGTCSYNISGGYISSGSGDAIGNSVTINGGIFPSASIIGGVSDTGKAVNNTVTLSGNPDFGAIVDIYGGYNLSGTSDVFTGNTLNVLNYGGSPAEIVVNFQYYNFTFSGSQSGPVLTVTRTASLGNGTTGSSIKEINTLTGASVLKTGATVTLIDAANLVLNGFNQTQAEGTNGSFFHYDWLLSAANNKLTATLIGVQADPHIKILSEGAAAGAILAAQGAENINGLLSGLQEGKIEAAASVFGGSSKYDTGSSVDMNATGIGAGVAKKFNSISAGIFAEYADASFDTEYNGFTGDGKATAIGLGILAKEDIKDVYIEGLIRAGQLSNDYKNKLDASGKTDYDYSSMYFGFSLGAGYIFNASGKIDIDFFGKYALTSVDGSEADLTTGDKYKTDSVLSSRIKAGAEAEYKITDAVKPYLALFYDYELSGEIKAQLDGYDMEAPSLSGGTLAGGLGVNAKIANITLDLGAQLYSGVREGATGSLKVKYEF